MKIEGRVQNATARGTDTDCVSRSFCPKLSIAEDPVCGSAHCQIADYWSKELNKDSIIAYQASKRGDTLYCHILGNGRTYAKTASIWTRNMACASQFDTMHQCTQAWLWMHFQG